MPKLGHTIKSLTFSYENGELDPAKVYADYIAKIKEQNPELNAYLRTFEYNSAEPGLLHGIPCALKDNILVDGSISTAGSKILGNYISSYDATVTKKLRSAGALILGKTNCDEFAMGSSTENSAFGPTKNPLDLLRVPGGSSGGSAAAVAADLCVFALGSDTGGSIRQPASFCGIVGLKPTYGRVSRSGLIAMASSLDQIGPLTKTVYDAAYVLNLISGQDTLDATTVAQQNIDFTLRIGESIKGVKIGVPKEFFGEGLDPEVRERVEESIAKLKEQGAELVEISLPYTAYALATYYIVMPSEVSSNLARFDGIRYGHSSQEAENIAETYFKSRAEGFGPEARRRILLGTYALSSGYYDAYYLKAQKVRALIRRDFDMAFEKVDAIVGPTTPSVAFKIGEKTSDPLAMYLSDIYTVPVNLAGLPAISVPCGLGKTSKLPVGLHIIGRMFGEETILRLADKVTSD